LLTETEIAKFIDQLTETETETEMPRKTETETEMPTNSVN
jgi:hypothetical protein